MDRPPDIQTVVQDEVVRLLRDRARLWKRASFALGTCLLLGAGAVWAAVSVTDSSGIQGMYAEVFGHDESKFTIAAVAPQPSLGRATAGSSFASPVEMAPAGAVATNGPGLLDWEYVATVAELSDGSVPDASPQVYKATLYKDGVSMGSLYFTQSTQTAGIENVRLIWDLGTSLPASAAFLLDIRLASG